CGHPAFVFGASRAPLILRAIHPVDNFVVRPREYAHVTGAVDREKFNGWKFLREFATQVERNDTIVYAVKDGDSGAGISLRDFGESFSIVVVFEQQPG